MSHLRNNNDRTGVFRYDAVRGQKRYAFGFHLRQQYSVKRIPVDRRQVVDRQSMKAGDAQLLVLVVQQAAPKHFGIHPEITPTETFLDANFPNASRTEAKNVVRVGHQPENLFGQRASCCHSSMCVSNNSFIPPTRTWPGFFPGPWNRNRRAPRNRRAWHRPATARPARRRGFRRHPACAARTGRCAPPANA